MSELEVYKAALERIVRAANEWDANRLGGVNIQRKRWERCGEIARQALSIQDMLDNGELEEVVRIDAE